MPTHVVVRGNCSQSFAEVSWRASSGALSYQATASDEDGQRLLCSSSQTSCRLEGLVCSQVYSIGVTASKDNCSSNESSAVTLQTGKAWKDFRNSVLPKTEVPTLKICVPAAPCPPSQLNVSMNCANNSAWLSWSISPNALSYTGKAANSQGHTVACEARASLQCRLLGLHCGREYTFTVSASAGDCQSPDSEPVILNTGEREQLRSLCLSLPVKFINSCVLKCNWH